MKLVPKPAELFNRALSSRVDPVVAAIVESILAAETDGTPPDPEDLAFTAEGMKDRLQRMPRYLGAGIRAMTVLFDGYALARGGRPFARLDLATRQKLVRQWKFAPVGFCRDFVDFYEKMGIFVYYSHVEEKGE